ncbi:hypothetical protein D7027_21000 [Ochrobactrum intermedium]|nr:hypothetical protein [Brucella intermedia]
MIAAYIIVILSLGGAAVFYYKDQLLPVHSVVTNFSTEKSDKPVKSDGDDPFEDHVKQAGVETCGAAFPAMGKLLTRNSQYMVQSKWNREEPERHIVEGLVGMQFDTPDYKGPSLGYVLAAPIDGSCSGAMLRITPFAQNCTALVERLLPDSTPTGELEGLRTYTVSNGSQIVVMPIGENCVAVSVGNFPS